MMFRIAGRLIKHTDKKILWKLFWNMGIGASRSVNKYKKRLKKDEYFPPFLYISIINSCNLRCQGCWVDVAAKQEKIEPEAMHRMINEAKEMGNRFFGILGGEPFMHPELLDIMAEHPDCYFQTFTNGHFITPEVAKRLRQMANVTPLISVEGNEIVSDTRRGREGVYSKTLEGIENCLAEKLLVGVCTSVCKTNIDDLVQEAWVDRLVKMGVGYLWYHTYRPVGPDACPDLALSPEEQKRIRQFVVDTRATKPIIVVDAYYDHDGKALCPAATGISHHIGPWGDVEPCPIIQMATDTIHDEEKSMYDKLNSPFMQDFRQLAAQTTRGCIVLERPDLLKQLGERHNARDTTVRGSSYAELGAMENRPSQYSPTDEIPERSWIYRFAKKRFYHDFGTYAKAEAPTRKLDWVNIDPPEQTPEIVEISTS